MAIDLGKGLCLGAGSVILGAYSSLCITGQTLRSPSSRQACEDSHYDPSSSTFSTCTTVIGSFLVNFSNGTFAKICVAIPINLVTATYGISSQPRINRRNLDRSWAIGSLAGMAVTQSILSLLGSGYYESSAATLIGSFTSYQLSRYLSH